MGKTDVARSLQMEILMKNVTTSQKEFNNQVGRMSHSVGSQCYSLAIPVISQWAQEQSSHGGRD